MPRKAEGWRLWRDPRTGIYHVRFRHAGCRQSPSTGSSDRSEALEAAPRVYAEFVSGRRQRGLTPARPGLPTAEVGALWIETKRGTVIERTIDMLESHLRLIGSELATMADLTDYGVARYIQRRLGEVRRSTLVKELSTLRQLATWAASPGVGYLSHVPKIESPSKRVLGTRNAAVNPKGGAVLLTDDEARAIIRRIPETARRARVGSPPRPVRERDFFVVLWETGLRPVSVGRLSVPEHYQRGAAELNITADVDKVRFGRPLPLTDGCRAALERSATEGGLIFGQHDFRYQWEKARSEAIAAGEVPHEKGRCSPYDYRHGRATQLANSTTNLAGVAYLLGHRHVSTTARYVHPDKKAAAEVLGCIRDGSTRGSSAKEGN